MKLQGWLDAAASLIYGFAIGFVVAGFIGLVLGLMYGATKQLFLLALRVMK